jgi:GntR family transcriptional regulator, transcriptional repressor for pyruvate dehydrogenase complex
MRDMRENEDREPKLSYQVYERIFELIVSGEYPEGSRLPSEFELSRRFGASRPIVREALARLRDDGLIVSRQGSGSYVQRRPDAAVLRFVPVGSIADIQRCFEFRVGLEGAAAALAAERWEEEDLAEIKAALQDLEECIRDGRLGVDADARFHRAIAQATHNPFHVSVQRSLEPHMAFGMNLARNLSLLRPATRLAIVQKEHELIVAATEARSGSRARIAMETHIENARRRVFEGTQGKD